jgi:hypothetical protein
MGSVIERYRFRAPALDEAENFFTMINVVLGAVWKSRLKKYRDCQRIILSDMATDVRRGVRLESLGADQWSADFHIYSGPEEGLFRHWLTLGLLDGRARLERFAPLNEITLSPLPAAATLQPPGGERFALPEPDGPLFAVDPAKRTVLTDLAADVQMRNLDKSSPSERQALEAVIASGKCGCPYCAVLPKILARHRRPSKNA